jgi:hypothetical protein
MAGLLRSLFRGQQHSSGWIFHGAFAALARGPRRGATDQDALALLKWAETYWNRQMPSSFAGHSRKFCQHQIQIGDPEQATILLADLHACNSVQEARSVLVLSSCFKPLDLTFKVLDGLA